MTAVFAALTLAAVGWLLVAERRDSSVGIWTWKPVASSGFVATALAAGALDGSYGRLVLAALCFCWTGDVLLIPDDTRIFRAGILAFLVGHLAFAAAFVWRGVDPRIAVLMLGAQSISTWATLRWLMPHLRRGFRRLVPTYVCVISIMVAAAAATYATSRCVPLLAGAIAFALSDLSVARDRFVRREFVNRAWGLPLYYAAELLLAVSIPH
jgi:uncharacterized membrane protein YhhN